MIYQPTYVTQCVQKESNRMRYIQYTKTNYVATVYAANMHVSEDVSSFVILSAMAVPSILPLKVIRSITSLLLPRGYNVNYYRLLLLP